MAPVKTSRGRPRTFNEKKALEDILVLFWNKGYSAVSIQDIVSITGMNKSSIYNTFVSKELLFEKVLDRYFEIMTENFQDLVDGTKGLDDIIESLSTRSKSLTSGDSPCGCLGLNAAMELGPHDEVAAAIMTQYRKTFINGISAALRRAVDLGEIQEDTHDTYLNALYAASQSMMLQSRANVPTSQLMTSVQLTIKLIESWRLPVSK